MSTYSKIALFLFLFISCSGGLSAQSTNPMIIREKDENLLVESRFIEIFEDTTLKADKEGIFAGKYDSFFVKNPDYRIAKNPKAVYWLRFSLKFESLRPRLLEVLDLHIDQLHVFFKEADRLAETEKTGYSSPFGSREYRHKNFVYQLPESKEFTVYIQIRSERRNAFFFKVRSPLYFTDYALTEYYLLGAYYGILAIMAIYNMLLFFYVRERVYWYYVLYVLSCMIFSLTEDGIGFHLFWPDYPIVNDWIDNSSQYIFLQCFIMLYRHFFDFEHRMPQFARNLRRISVTYFAYFIVSLFFPYTQRNALSFVYMLPILLIYGATFRLYFKGFRKITQFFLLGYTFTIFGVIAFIMRRNGFTMDSIAFVYTLNFGLLTEIVFFSLALAYRLRLIKLEKEAAVQRNIQELVENERFITEKVGERTAEIYAQKKIIETKNEELSEANRILESQAATLTQQAEEIRRMNEVLNRENIALQTDVEDLTKARVMLSDVDYEEFRRIFPDENSCYRYLSELKWKAGFVCVRCENDKYAPGQGHYARRCTKCRYNESCTVNTLFYRCRIPVLKAFYMLFLVYAHKGQITSQKLSEILELRQNTCWKFSRKILDKMKSDAEANDRPATGNGWSRLILD